MLCQVEAGSNGVCTWYAQWIEEYLSLQHCSTVTLIAIVKAPEEFVSPDYVNISCV